MRTLRLSRTAPQLEYQYETCTNSFIGICTKYAWVKEVYDLTDAVQREKLINMGFVFRRKEDVQ